METKTTVKLLIHLLRFREILETVLNLEVRPDMRIKVIRHVAWMDQRITDMQEMLYGPNWWED